MEVSKNKVQFECLSHYKPTLRQMYSTDCLSEFVPHQRHKNIKSIMTDLHGYSNMHDMVCKRRFYLLNFIQVLELTLYFIELENDTSKKAVTILNTFSKTVIWSEVRQDN